MSGDELRRYQVPINFNTSEESIQETSVFLNSNPESPVPESTTISQPKYTSTLNRPASLRSLGEIRQVPLDLGRPRNVRSQTDFEPSKQLTCNGTQTEFVVSPNVLEKLHTSVDLLKTEIATLVAQVKQEGIPTNNINSQLEAIKRQIKNIYAAKVQFSDETKLKQVYYKPSSIITCQILSPIYVLCSIIVLLQTIILGLIFHKL